MNNLFMKEKIAYDSFIRTLTIINSKNIELFDAVVNSRSYYDRYDLARNKNLPFKYIELLSWDARALTRMGVARNKNTPIEILKKLLKDYDSEVVRIALRRLKDLEDE